jgi:hypothetical protein
VGEVRRVQVIHHEGVARGRMLKTFNRVSGLSHFFTVVRRTGESAAQVPELPRENFWPGSCKDVWY